MTKILLVEKTYSNNGENPLVTAKWIELPDGEEELFMMQQVSNTTNSSFLEEKNDKSLDSVHNVQETEVLDEKKNRYLLACLAVFVAIFLLAVGFVYEYVGKTKGW
jgi:hypothetical protein